MILSHPYCSFCKRFGWNHCSSPGWHPGRRYGRRRVVVVVVHSQISLDNLKGPKSNRGKCPAPQYPRSSSCVQALPSHLFDDVNHAILDTQGTRSRRQSCLDHVHGCHDKAGGRPGDGAREKGPQGSEFLGLLVVVVVLVLVLVLVLLWPICGYVSSERVSSLNCVRADGLGASNPAGEISKPEPLNLLVCRHE